MLARPPSSAGSSSGGRPHRCSSAWPRASDGSRQTRGDQVVGRPAAVTGGHYKWVALSNTTAAVFMSALDGYMVIIGLTAIFRGIHLDPLAPGNVTYLLWMTIVYRRFST